MELWIRSQDKRHLLKVDNINWFGGELYTNNSVRLETTKDGKTYLLGIYHNGKRALKVLDEIQKILNPMIIFNNCKCTQDVIENIKEPGTCFVTNDAYIEQVSTCVYEMPKE